MSKHQHKTRLLPPERGSLPAILLGAFFLLMFQVVTIDVLCDSARAQLSPLAPSASEIQSTSRTALSKLYRENEAARALGDRAKAVLVFPSMKKGAFIIGAQDGYGALFQGSSTTGYHRTGAASYGFQAGVKSFGYALFFMSDSAIHYLDASGGWAIGTGPSLVVID